MMKNLRITAIAAAVALSSVAGSAVAQSTEVNIYSYREPGLIQPLLDLFTEETGIKANVLFAGNGLIERVAAEGELSPVDVVLTVDIGNLAAAKEQGITQAISDAALARVPEAFRDPDGQWVALSLRARVFYASKDRVTETALSYEDIAGPEWDGRLCTRPGDHVYNIGLIANRIAVWGLDETRDWLAAVRDNLAFAPTGSDRSQVKSILEGSCDLAIVNTYYMGLMLTNEEEPEQQEWAAAARIIYPDAEGTGTQVNVSGAVLSKWAPNQQNGEKLIEFLLSDEGQRRFVEETWEYPVVDGIDDPEGIPPLEELEGPPLDLTDLDSLEQSQTMLTDVGLLG